MPAVSCRTRLPGSGRRARSRTTGTRAARATGGSTLSRASRLRAVSIGSGCSTRRSLRWCVRASTVGWYAKLHEELEPTNAERLDRLDRYLALVTSPAPAVVKEGLAALREIEDAMPPEAFARFAPTPFTQRQKNLSTETLAMLARLCKRRADARPVLLEAAAHALAHERVDVQERALKLLEQYPGDVPRAALLAYVEAVSPTLRARVEALTGVAARSRSCARSRSLQPSSRGRPSSCCATFVRSSDRSSPWTS